LPFEASSLIVCWMLFAIDGMNCDVIDLSAVHVFPAWRKPTQVARLLGVGDHEPGERLQECGRWERRRPQAGRRVGQLLAEIAHQLLGQTARGCARATVCNAAYKTCVLMERTSMNS